MPDSSNDCNRPDPFIAPIGFSLPFAMFASDGPPPEGSFAAAYGGVDACLLHLVSCGVESIELRSIRPEDDPSVVLLAAEKIRACGLALTIHGALTRSLKEASSLQDAYPALWALRPLVEGQPVRCVVTVHPFAAKQGDEQALFEETVETARRLCDLSGESDAPFIFALELMRRKQQVDPGVTYDGVLNMVDRIDRPNMGICWDLGHTLANIDAGVVDDSPPPAFLRNVIHTHIHDRREQTHRPILDERSPVRPLIETLLRAGYRDVMNLELSAHRFDTPMLEGVERSVQIVREIIQQTAFSR